MMKKNFVLTLLICFSLISSVFSQDEVAIIIGNRNISLTEFERLYKKNSAAISMEQQNMEEYIERFVNFKLKVIEAENAGNDTTESFLNEFNSYRSELAKPYMMDSAFQEVLLRQAYNKITKEINASHILIEIDPNAAPSDTLSAWKKIMDIREKALNGEDFGTLAEQNSSDPSAAQNKGNLGWFSAFRMVPEFEDMAFVTPAGEISLPVRSRFGYHIIKVNEIRPAMGSVQVAHIYVRVPPDAGEEEAIASKNKTFEIYKELKTGADFSELANTHSDDRASAVNGGKLQWFSTGMMIPEFENTAFSLSAPGQYSEPVQSFYGWHIIQLLDRKKVGTYEEERPELMNRINADNYKETKRMAFIEKLKEEHSYTLNRKVLEEVQTYIDSSFHYGTWTASSISAPGKTLFTIGNQKVTLGEFGKYLGNSQKAFTGNNLTGFINERFNKFSEERVYGYEESLLADKYPDFKYILQEYHDGILLFDLTDKMVWSKAVNDTIGLENFFKQNRKDYTWDTRADAVIVTVKDPSLVAEARKLTSKRARKKDFSNDFLLEKLCPEDTTGTCLALVAGNYEKGSNELIDSVEWKKGLKDNVEKDGMTSFVYIKKILKPSPKELDETRGLVISDYQEYLEKQWVKELREKYPVTVNRDVISKIKP